MPRWRREADGLSTSLRPPAQHHTAKESECACARVSTIEQRTSPGLGGRARCRRAALRKRRPRRSKVAEVARVRQWHRHVGARLGWQRPTHTRPGEDEDRPSERFNARVRCRCSHCNERPTVPPYRRRHRRAKCCVIPRPVERGRCGCACADLRVLRGVNDVRHGARQPLAPASRGPAPHNTRTIAARTN